jgi:hypothetical protein
VISNLSGGTPEHVQAILQSGLGDLIVKTFKTQPFDIKKEVHRPPRPQSHISLTLTSMHAQLMVAAAVVAAPAVGGCCWWLVLAIAGRLCADEHRLGEAQPDLPCQRWGAPRVHISPESSGTPTYL